VLWILWEYQRGVRRATSGTVSFLLSYAASQSNAGGTVWYAQNKAIQGLAKNTFDAINNQVANIAP